MILLEVRGVLAALAAKINGARGRLTQNSIIAALLPLPASRGEVGFSVRRRGDTSRLFGAELHVAAGGVFDAGGGVAGGHKGTGVDL